MNQDHVKVLVSRRMEQATGCLEDGRFLLSAKRGARTVVNRAYYAAFYAVLALLQTTGRTPRKHKGVLALFDSEFVKPGLLSRNVLSSRSEKWEGTLRLWWPWPLTPFQKPRIEMDSIRQI